MESGRLVLRHNLPNESKLPIAYFGRCFISNSILSGVLRTKDAEEACKKKISITAEVIPVMRNVSVNRSLSWSKKLCTFGCSIRNSLPSVSHLYDVASNLTYATTSHRLL